MIRVGIDTGGTFTDFAFFDGKGVRINKVHSTLKDPSLAVVKGLKDVLGGEVRGLEIVLGTTVATNALLERRGSRVALITTKGFEDVIEIGRQNRGELYNLFWKPPKPLVSRELRFGVIERTDFRGRVLTPVNLAEIEKLSLRLKRFKVEGVAISFLHSYANPTNEKKAEKILKLLGIPVSRSSKILPEFREYERSSTTLANSYLLTIVKSYMDELLRKLPECRIHIMHSGGGIVSPAQAGEEPVRLILSGPAGGVVGGFKIADTIGYKKIITYDMGGTSTDVALCNGALKFTTENSIDGIPIKIPMVDVMSIGAGGGSIAYIDTGGALKVGPMSAGAEPGPACYGMGSNATVTDANLALRRINPDWFLGGKMRIFLEKSRQALGALADKVNLSVDEVAEGIIKVANAKMERALRVISIGRGFDPREFALLSFGGAGGLHACELALGLGIKTVIFPRDPGALSALGMLMADSFKDYSLTTFLSGKKASLNAMEKGFRVLEDKARREFQGERIEFERYLDARYRRQSHEITIPYGDNFVRTFHQAHKKLSGYLNPEGEVEVVTLRARAIIKKEKLLLPRLTGVRQKVETKKEELFFDNKPIEVSSYRRDDFFAGFKFSSPALILESNSTLFIPPGFRCEVDDWGSILAKI